MNPSSRILLLAGDSELIAASRAAFGKMHGAELSISAPCDPRSLNGSLSNASAVVMELDLGGSEAIADFVELTRSAPPGCRVIAAARNAASGAVRDLFRSGAADVLTAPFTAQALTEALAISKPAVARGLGKVVVVLKGAGGAGATLVTASLATALQNPPRKAARPARRIAILDLDLQFGDVALAFDAEPRHTVLDALKSGPRLDANLFQGLLTDTDDGVRVLAAPPQLLPLDAMGAEAATRLIAESAAAHDLTLVEMPSAWTDWTAPVLATADAVVLVTPATVAGAAGARRVLDMLIEIGAASEVLLMINRSGGLIERSDRAARIAKALDLTAAAVLAEDPAAAKAADRGRPVIAFAPHSRLGKDLETAARTLDARLFTAAQIRRGAA